MQPLKYLTPDHPYVIIKDSPDGSCNIRLGSKKPKDYDPRVILKKIYEIVKHNIPYVTKSNDVCYSGKELWQTLKGVAREIVSINTKNHFICVHQKYNQALKKQYERIDLMIFISINYRDSNKVNSYLTRSEQKELFVDWALTPPGKYRQASEGKTLLFKYDW